MRDAAVCDDCLIKFNEYDEYQKLSAQIHQEISSLFFSNLNDQDKEEENPMDLQPKTEVVDPDDVLVYHGLQNQISHEEMILAQEVVDFPENVNLVEVAEIDKRNLPKKFQTMQKGEKQKVVKTRSVKSEKESFTIVQLDNNIQLYQCEICSRTFKEKSKLKAHKEIHTTERNIVCPVGLKFPKIKRVKLNLKLLILFLDMRKSV